MMRSTSLLFVLRRLRKNPATSVLAVVAFGFGIGLTTTMFTVVHGLLMSPLPFEDPDRLVALTSYKLDEGWTHGLIPRVSLHDFVQWQEQTSLEGLAAAGFATVNLNDEAGYPERVRGGLVTWNTFRVLGVEPVLGRDFSAEDDVPGSARVVILGHDIWQSRFAGDPKVLGRTISIDGEPTTVLGVMPQGFRYPFAERLWQPLRPDVMNLSRGQGPPVFVIGRLGGEASLAHARAEFQAIVARQAEDSPETNAGLGIRVQNYRRSLNKDSDNAMGVLMLGSVSLVLIIACANVASLLIARASMRGRELAIRTALGARRRRVMGLIVMESLVLSLLGSVLGLAVAYLAVTAFDKALSWRTLGFWFSAQLQPASIVFVAAAGTAAGLLSGTLPALRASGAVTFDLLKDESHGSTGLRIGRLSRWLVIGELALACALMVATGLTIRTVLNHNTIDPGFETDSIYTASLSLDDDRYPAPTDKLTFYERLVDDLEAHPEVESAAVMSSPPGTYMGSSTYAIEGETYKNHTDYPRVPSGVVSPEFFDVYGIELIEGRLLTRHDTGGNPLVLVVNQGFAKHAWPGESALGKRLCLTPTEPDCPWRTVVGVVPEAGISLIQAELHGTTEMGFYMPHAQRVLATMAVAVKTRGEPSAFAATLRERVGRLDAGLPVDQEKTMQRIVWEHAFQFKFIAVIFSFFGGFALVLASVGIFGVMMFSVQQRTREVGVRMALGAGPRQVLGLILRQGLGSLGIGLALGLLLAVGLGSVMRAALYGVEPTDPLTFLGTVLTLGSVAFLACYVPAWRATRVDPIVALRSE